jgi:formylglycine-generating enzyme required for sulfatase activity
MRSFDIGACCPLALTVSVVGLLGLAAMHVSPSAGADAAKPLAPAGERALKAGDSFRECNDCPEMVLVPAGSFTMGSPLNEAGRDADEGPQHVVTLAQPFAVAKFEVTVRQFAAFATETGHDAGPSCWTFEDGKGEERADRSWRNPGFVQDGSHPAACLNWHDAAAYASWLAGKTGKPYRLLTEAEWEYSARAPTTSGAATRYSFGDDDDALCRNGNGPDHAARRIKGAGDWAAFACDDGFAYTAPVGSFPPNAFGLHDVHGNVWEWTQDCYHASYDGAPANGAAWLSGDCSRHVLRGGSWTFAPTDLRVANRSGDVSDDRGTNYGMRVARTLAP